VCVRVQKCACRRHPRIKQTRRFERGFEAGTIFSSDLIAEAAQFPKRSARTIDARFDRSRVWRWWLRLPSGPQAVAFINHLLSGRGLFSSCAV
jgi:hypothetical protein